ncbi:crooked neck-like protein 1, partial [Tanacetum coccineum]
DPFCLGQGHLVEICIWVIIYVYISRITRAVLRNTIGFVPKDKIFKKYIEIEQQLGNMDRCRKLYEKYLEWSPENCYAWSKYAELERSLMETERARTIFELTIAQPALDMPELLWKSEFQILHLCFYWPACVNEHTRFVVGQLVRMHNLMMDYL